MNRHSYPEEIIIEEQGLRDGFQVERKIVPTEKKLQYLYKLIEAGIKRIQVASFVHPKLVPQMADADEICRNLPKCPDVIFSALVLNMKGLERAIQAGIQHVAISISASNTHSLKNTGMTLEKSQVEFQEMVKEAKKVNLTVRGGIQCAFGCRYEGWIDPKVVIELTKKHVDLGIDELALADSTGMAHPKSVQELMQEIVPLTHSKPLILHLHDTEGRGIANALTAMQMGVRYFDTAFGGLGGCVFIKGATGNIATEDFAFMLEQMNIQTGIDIAQIVSISENLSDFFEKKMEAKINRNILKRTIE